MERRTVGRLLRERIFTLAFQPIAELFGFPPDSTSATALQHIQNRYCPFNNKVPHCTKDSVTNPLGVCSIHAGPKGNELAVICPVRLRQDWLLTSQAKQFFFPEAKNWTTLVEVRLKDKNNKSAGNIDIVLVAYDDNGQVTDFGALEVQSVYISGNLRKAFFQPLMDDAAAYLATDWIKSRKTVPRPDYLSSSRKRLAPQLIFKGGILKAWGRKQAVAVHSAFYATLPELPEVPEAEADIAWLIYDLIYDAGQHRYQLTPTRTVYTAFKPSLDRITLSEPGPIEGFIADLQVKLAAQRAGADLSDLSDVPEDVPADETDLVDELENL